MRIGIIILVALLMLPGLAAGTKTGTLDVKRGVMSDVSPPLLGSGADCVIGSYYMLDACGFATVVEGIGENETFGVCFSMSEPNAFHTPCDTLACMRLDIVELVFYDVLGPPADQGMNLKVYAADADGNPTGGLLGNRDFEPAYVDTALFASVEIDFTNGGMEPGLDLSGCSGCFVALLTWRNSTGHPCAPPAPNAARWAFPPTSTRGREPIPTIMGARAPGPSRIPSVILKDAGPMVVWRPSGIAASVPLERRPSPPPGARSRPTTAENGFRRADLRSNPSW